MARVHDYKTPKGEFVERKSPNGKVSFEIKWNPGFGPKISETLDTVQKHIDAQVLFLCDPYVPKDTGILKQSGILNTQIGSGEVKYRTPYARRWYYMPAKFNEGSGSGMNTVGRGNYWFERMRQQHKQQILEEAQKRIAEGFK